MQKLSLWLQKFEKLKNDYFFLKKLKKKKNVK